MLRKNFDPKQNYRAVIYARMSTAQQNERSPEQQVDEIRRRMKSLDYHWNIVKVYRDDAISGRYQSRRLGYQEMLREIRTGAINTDLILVDTLERLGRVEELPTIRKELLEQHGVLVLTGDVNFCDPTSPQGKAFGMIEAMRATEDGRIKAHNVLRGKRDAAMRKRWPGGPPPFGYMLRTVMKTVNGREEVDYCLLVPNPATRWIIELLFELAEQTSHGATRLAKLLNADTRIPDEQKPFQPETIAYWLNSSIYFGDLIWAKNSTGIVNDVRVVEANAPEDVVKVAEYCEPLVSRERWNNVQAVRQVRRERSLAARQRKQSDDGKLIKAKAPGMTLNYLLSGLLYCECGLRMVASSGGAYITRDGTQRRYAGYVCPGYVGGHCENNSRVPEEWIRSVVINKLRERLFPDLL